MKPYPPYTDQQWEADYRTEQLGHALACPDCKSDVWYHAIHRFVEGARFRYRLCKRCGFWQAADGHSAPVRCWLSLHACTNQDQIRRGLYTGGPRVHLRDLRPLLRPEVADTMAREGEWVTRGAARLGSGV